MFITLTLAPSFSIAQQENSYQNILERGQEAGIATERLETLVSRAENYQIGPDELNRLIDPAITLAGRDLPYDPVLQKTMEGMAKGVSVNAIHQVLGQMEGGLSRSAELIDPWLKHEKVRSMVVERRGAGEPSDGEQQFRNRILENTSYALQHNIREETLQDFLDQVVAGKAAERGGMASIASAIRTLPDLPMSQDNPEMSNRILLRALNAGFSDGEIQQLPDAFQAAQFRTQMPLENIAKGTERQMQQGAPPEHVIENLFRGNVGGGPPGFSPPGLERGRDNGNRPGRGGPPDDDPPGNNGRGEGGPPDDVPPGNNGPPVNNVSS